MIKSIQLIITFIFTILFINSGLGQNYQISMSGWTSGVPQLNTYQEMSGGKMQNNQVTIQIAKKWSGNELKQWKLTAKLSDDHINTQDANYSFGAQYAQLSFSQESQQGTQPANPSNTPVTLSKYNEVDLIESNIPFNKNTYVQRQITYNLFIMGGTHLLVNDNGQYRATYEFRLYGRDNSNQSYSLVASYSSSNVQSGVHINYSGNHGNQSIELQNGADTFNFLFSEVDDYVNGKSIEVPNGLKVTTYNNYNLIVKSSNSEFVSQTTSTTIPISALHIEAALDPMESNVNINGPLTMSASDQTLIARTATNPQTLEYDIRFFIPPNQIQNPIEAATYTAYIYFTIVPN
jgi:hypothetical protein